MSHAHHSTANLHARWRLRACVRVLLLALPWFTIALLLALAEPGQPLRQMLPGFLLLAVLERLVNAWRRRDLPWFAGQLNRHAGLEDSAGLLLGLEAPASSLARLQRERLQARWRAIDAKALRPRLPRAPLLWNLIAGLACAAAVWAWHRPIPENVRAQLPPALAQVAGLQSPSLRAIRIDIDPPAYTGLPTRTAATADMRVPEASTLRWTFRFSVAPARAWLQFEDGPRIELQENDGNWRAGLRIDRSMLYRIVTEPTLPPAQRRLHRIETIVDQPPQVRATTPTQSLSLRSPEQRQWPLVFEASDDYGIAVDAELRIIQTSGEGENISASERSLPLAGSGPAKARRFAYIFDLARSGLTVGNDVIVQLSVRDNRSPQPHVVRSASVILRWSPGQMGMASSLEGLVQQVVPAYFRSQRQIIIDSEKLLREKRTISAEVFARRSNAIGADQSALRLRYGQFLGETEGSMQLPTSDGAPPTEAPSTKATTADAAAVDRPAAGVNHDQGKTGSSGVDPALAEVSHVHDMPEAATLLDSRTQSILRAALGEMRDAETRLRLAQPQQALPFAYKALGLIKQVQQADRIYLPKVSSELPPIDFSRRLSGKRDDLAARSSSFVATPDASMPLDALWRALGPDRDGSEVSKPMLDDASRWLHAHVGDERDALAAIVALDAVRQQPACSSCRDELRQRIWPLLAMPLAKPVARPRATPAGNAYLDALQREVSR